MTRAGGAVGAASSVRVRSRAGRLARLDPEALAGAGVQQRGLCAFPARADGSARAVDEVRAAGPDPDIPLVLLSAMGFDAFIDELLTPEIRASAQQSAQAKHRCYENFVASMPRAELRRIDNAGHSGLVCERSDAVLDAIRDVLSPGSTRRP